MAARHTLRKLVALNPGFSSPQQRHLVSRLLCPAFYLAPDTNFGQNLHPDSTSTFGHDEEFAPLGGHYGISHVRKSRDEEDQTGSCFDGSGLVRARLEKMDDQEDQYVEQTNRWVEFKSSDPGLVPASSISSLSFTKILVRKHATPISPRLEWFGTRPENAPIASLLKLNTGFATSRTVLPLSGRPVFQGVNICNSSTLGPNLVRFSSNVGEGLHDKMGDLQTDYSDVSLTAGNFGSSASEVAAATVDCTYPSAFLQLLIENVHIHAGLPWWASIAVTTIAIRTIMIPVVIFQMRAGARFALVKPEMEKITNRIKESGYDYHIVHEQRKRMKELLVKNHASPFTPFLGAIVQIPVFMCFFFGIRNMAGNVESFKEGGALWFTDLSTVDSTYILPVLTALTLWITVELGAADGMEGNPMGEKMKTALRIFAALSVPVSATFEKALFFYWLTSNVWSLCQSYVLRRPVVKAALGIVDTPLAKDQNVSIKPVELFSQRPRKVKMPSPEQRSKRAYKRK